MQRAMQIGLGAPIGAVTTLLNVSLTVVFAVNEYRYMSMVYAAIITSLGGAFATAYVGWRYLDFRICFEAGRYYFLLLCG